MESCDVTFIVEKLFDHMIFLHRCSSEERFDNQNNLYIKKTHDRHDSRCMTLFLVSIKLEMHRIRDFVPLNCEAHGIITYQISLIVHPIIYISNRSHIDK